MPFTVPVGIAVASLGGALLFVAGREASRRRAFLRASATTTGQVVDLAKIIEDARPSFFPKVTFRTPAGREVTFESAAGSERPAVAVGDSVAVRYHPDNPETAEIDTFFALWGFSVLLGTLGSAFALVGAGLLLGWIPT